ncbi:MAG: efflux RND transporter permease subunit, partial [Bacteroidales bacterium]|nr:efflux RND transporter permease subunit [Bacteroidales bacterium]
MAKGNIFVDRKVMACSVAILISLIGFIALKTLPVEQYPDIAPPTIMVSTSYTGADASTVMKSVITPLEESINGVEDMAYISSEASSNGDVSINVFFKQGTNPDMAAVNVQNRVSKAMNLLPAEVTKNGVTVEKRQNSMLQMTALVSRDGKFDEGFVSNYIDINVKPRLQRISGIGGIQLLGNTYSLRIWMKPDVMARYSLTPSDVFMAIDSQNLVMGTGSLGESSENSLQYTMEYKGRLTSIQEFRDIVIRTSSDGHLLHLSDVADVELGSLSYSFSSTVDHQPGTVFIIYQSAGANATKVNAEINKLYKSMEKQLPPGLEFTTLLTSDDFLHAAMHNVVETLIIAILLVILVVFFFLQDFKATIVPSISIIVSLLGTFAVVKAAGFSLNILTLFALVLAIGTVVDDAIVVVEAVMAKLENGYTSTRSATRDALGEVTTAVFSCTLVFMAVFIPVTFMPGTSGTFFTQFGVTLASSVGISCLSALVICPALCVMLMKPHDNEDGGKKGLKYYTRAAYTASYNAIAGKYFSGIGKFTKRPVLSWLLLALAAGLMIFSMKSLPSGLVPQEDQGVILVDVAAPEGSTLYESGLIMSQVEAKLSDIEEIESYSKISGFGIINGVGSSYGTLVIRLKNWDDRKGLQHYIDMVIYRLYLSCEDIKDAVIMPFQMPQIPGYGNANGMELILEDFQGGDMSEFNDISRKFIGELQKRKEVQMAMSTYSESFPKYKVELNSVQCDRVGVSPSTILQTLGAYCGGAYVGNYNQYGKIYRLMASAAPEYRLDPSSLRNIFVKVGDGKMAPISQFVTLVPSVGSSVQKRFNLFQSIFCQVTPASGYAQGDLLKVIEEVAAENLPQGYGYEFGGMTRELAANAGSSTTGIIYIICIVLIYLILGCLYESWFIPFAVLLSVPFGLMGSFFVSWLCGLDNNIYLQTGVIMLIGLLA